MPSNWYGGLGRVAREAVGAANVIEEAGAATRGHGGMDTVESIIIHHTAGAWNQARPADYNSRITVLFGHPGAKGPLAHYGVGRVTGKVYWFAAGLCAHAGRDSLVLARKYRNVRAIGIEIENNGVNEPYSDVTYRNAVALTAQLVKEFGLTVNDVKGHKEIALTERGTLGRKTDPSFNMDKFRADVTAKLATGNGLQLQGSVSNAAPAPTPTTTKENTMALTPEETKQLASIYTSTSTPVVLDQAGPKDYVTVAGALQRQLILERRNAEQIKELRAYLEGVATLLEAVHPKLDALIGQHTAPTPEAE